MSMPSCSNRTRAAPRSDRLAAFRARLGGADPLLLVLPADHHVADEERLRFPVGRVIPFAESGRVVVFGIDPSRPETGYGYIRVGEAFERCPAESIGLPSAAHGQIAKSMAVSNPVIGRSAGLILTVSLSGTWDGLVNFRTERACVIRLVSAGPTAAAVLALPKGPYSLGRTA